MDNIALVLAWDRCTHIYSYQEARAVLALEEALGIDICRIAPIDRVYDNFT